MPASWIPKIGDEFAAYRLEEMIGHGGMSIVYRARHHVLERSVALKLLSPELSEDPAFRDRFIRESRLAAGLDHPNVIPIYEAGEELGVYYIAMRYVPGSNLKELLQRDGPLDRAQTISVIGQIASALNAAHEMGLVHRDVKPANVLIVEGAGADDSHHVYLSDFGIAKQQASNVTRTGMFIGTAEYASPEQIESKELDGRSDVYSLGCVLYQCLTGNPAFEKDSEVALIYAHLLEPPPSIQAARPELGPAIDVVLARAMAKKPDDRYATARELSTAVREALSQPAAEPSSAPATQVVPPTPAPPVTVASPLAETPPVAPAIPADATAAAAPSAVAAPPPPEHPPAGQPPGRSGRRGWKGLGIAAGLVAAGAVGAVLAVVLLGGDGKGGAAQPTQQTAPAASVAPVSLLAALMPKGIAAQCKTAQTPSYGAVQTELCHPPANARPPSHRRSPSRSSAVRRHSATPMTPRRAISRSAVAARRAARRHGSTSPQERRADCASAGPMRAATR